MIDFKALLKPETEFEERLFLEPAFLRGLDWGKPRYGHPEGKVGYHVREVLDNIDALPVPNEVRRKLRIIAFAHDAFKYEVHNHNSGPLFRSNHGQIAYRFMCAYTQEEDVLQVIALHDCVFYAWKKIFLLGKTKEGYANYSEIINRIQDFKQLYYLFYKSDTCTGDKNPAPLTWFESNEKDIQPVSFLKSPLADISS